MQELTLSEVKKVQIKQPEFIYADSVVIMVAKDYGNRVEAELLLKNSITGNSHNVELTLWDGQDYIDIGVWTDQDVINRVEKLIITAF
jgi:hypothetical protein